MTRAQKLERYVILDALLRLRTPRGGWTYNWRRAQTFATWTEALRVSPRARRITKLRDLADLVTD
jgi:hypothetical protein